MVIISDWHIQEITQKIKQQTKTQQFINTKVCPKFCNISVTLITNLLDFKFFFFLLINTRSCHLVRIRWSLYILKYQRILWVSFSRTDSGFFIYHLSVCSNFKLLHNSLWITFSNKSCLILCELATFIYFVINHLISVQRKYTFNFVEHF